ncbi:probable splicing factor 3a, subunit 3 [Ramularia collo-cygni]|uniref:Probable splicing factor 3a, subunit 3 n=1 Tax=Ramularia collo-cygni TaxID=112498 RepID=A0A2D3UWY6_9PEZI|nr:probable splicing factor 3a, subunit 3 [Ramularia collo-cygni]CZT21321.1 probable splicing factor 3a, subunit 3 [Ramularia collo-cygni]
MIYEELRGLHEDIERLEQAVADRVLEEPKHIRSRLVRDHEIRNFLDRIQSQSQSALRIYEDREARTQEVQAISTGDNFETFREEVSKIKAFHERNPGEPVENLERAYKRPEDGGPQAGFAGDMEVMFNSEEAYGRFFDLISLHEQFLNLPGVKGVRKVSYLQYLDIFDAFTPPKCNITRQDKMTEDYFAYLGSLSEYLETFLRKTKPLEDSDRLLRSYEEEFEKEWEEDKVPGWESIKSSSTSSAPVTEGTGEGVWCPDCAKEFKNDNVYKAHLTGKRHIKAVESRTASGSTAPNTNGASAAIARLKERAVADREHRIRKLASTMQTEREDTRVNVERKAGMTDKERQQEANAMLYADEEFAAAAANGGEDANSDDEVEKVYNPLKLPLAWDGKPIPYWLFKLHGLGVEFPCEICGNFVYMGRRAFDKHFSEARHVYGLQCLGITRSTGLFREITEIQQAEKLWAKLESDRLKEIQRKGGENGEGVVEMEDHEGNVMPKKVYDDLARSGLL